ncbi:MAG TPA: heme-binding protein [Ktedonobacteraceae bacterium]|nr:heme-binding protein [Ktedonobacteraceae bacterium]
MSLTIEVARKVLEASKQRALELRSPVSIAIVDAGGHLILFERIMAPYGWATGNISLAKASTAVMFNQSTDAVAQWGSGIPGFASSMATMTQGRFIMAAGGWPIRIGGATVGGIGVSGGNAPGRDDEIARAGLAAVESIAPANPVMQFSNSMSQPAVLSYSQQSAPTYSSMPQQQPQVANALNSPMPQINPANTQHFASDQENPYSDEQVSYDQFNEARGDQS